MGNKLRLAAMLISVGLFMPLFVVRQWVRSKSNESVTFPIAFKEKVYYASSIHIGEAADPNHVVKYSSVTSRTSIRFLTTSAADFDQFALILGR
ncbi:hypothetical protein, partial [Megasphaera sp.]|uniref:gp53-like domain-containing protein n=1 Tax=Megasphaera sp. TaxID=2023260 RepID=UPI0025C28FE2